MKAISETEMPERQEAEYFAPQYVKLARIMRDKTGRPASAPDPLTRERTSAEKRRVGPDRIAHAPRCSRQTARTSPARPKRSSATASPWKAPREGENKCAAHRGKPTAPPHYTLYGAPGILAA